MGKVLIQMAADADNETLSSKKAGFQWPAPPKKAETEEAEEPAPTSSAEITEPSAVPVFFAKYGPCHNSPPQFHDWLGRFQHHTYLVRVSLHHFIKKRPQQVYA